MFCTYCNANRPQNEAPCPNCGAPSPLQESMNAGSWGMAGPQMTPMPQNSPGQFSSASNNQLPFNTPAPMNSWNQFSPAANSPVPQISFNAPPSVNDWSQFSPTNNSPTPQISFDAPPSVNDWNQLSPASNNQWNNQAAQMSFEASPASWGPAPQNSAQATQEPSKSLVPVSYQGQMGLQTQQAADMALPIIQSPNMGQMLPALPEDAVYVPPMYTKPRPIIPRYRIISGLLSILIVSLLVCGGASYYAKASGNLKLLGRAITGAPPARVQPTATPVLPDPPVRTDTGPAYNKIPAATTTLRIDKNYTPLQPTRIFQVGQQFYLTFTIPNPSGGTVTAKWYMNGQLYRETTVGSTTTKPGTGMVNAYVSMQYETPAEGTVELDWNNQLAQRLYFVVR
jgi:hypothetical protein